MVVLSSVNEGRVVVALAGSTMEMDSIPATISAKSLFIVDIPFVI